MYFIDLGLSKPWRKPNGAHIDPIKKRKHHTGTIYYLGLHPHAGYEASRRDDLQTLAIIVLNLLFGDLPWNRQDDWFHDKRRELSHSTGTPYHNLKRKRDKRMFYDKEHFLNHLGEYTKDIPKEFCEFTQYAHQLEFAETPRYSYWIDRFNAVIHKHRWQTVEVDWSVFLSTKDRDHKRIYNRFVIIILSQSFKAIEFRLVVLRNLLFEIDFIVRRCRSSTSSDHRTTSSSPHAAVHQLVRVE